ncbi:chemotaxis protein [Piscirickettsia litoralis]|uniref:Response regulator n=1 Tax=Piscirickettsia litoralis TaxID=1891921 RepID=A0ABX3A4G4_9GAMM|nr:chemotaxis protein [Piscirickettsia litoralis]ODN43738.1 response regulator [Piscirickettsia litoralis]
MSDLLKSIELQTDIAGKNRLELLLFRIGGKQIYGMNVFKVREVMYCPKLCLIPGRHPAVKGVVHVRGYKTISVVSLSKMLNRNYLDDSQTNVLLITEYNRSLIGFLVSSVEEIIHTDWSAIETPPSGLSNTHYLTAVTKQNEKLVEIIDIEKVLDEVVPPNLVVSEEVLDEKHKAEAHEYTVLVAEDSGVARRHIVSVLEQVGVQYILTHDGASALKKLLELVEDQQPVTNKLLMMISDIEMPRMDGYTLVKKCREHPLLKDLYIILNSSISGDFNRQMASKVEANFFLAKISGEELGSLVVKRIKIACGEEVEDEDLEEMC